MNVICDLHLKCHDQIEYYAAVIQKLQHELGLKITSFPDIKMMASEFFERNAENLPDHITGDEILELMMQKDRELFNSSLGNNNNNEEE